MYWIELKTQIALSTIVRSSMVHWGDLIHGAVPSILAVSTQWNAMP